MGIMRWTLLNRMRKAHPSLPVENTYGYLTTQNLGPVGCITNRLLIS